MVVAGCGKSLPQALDDETELALGLGLGLGRGLGSPDPPDC